MWTENERRRERERRTFGELVGSGGQIAATLPQLEEQVIGRHVRKELLQTGKLGGVPLLELADLVLFVVVGGSIAVHDGTVAGSGRPTSRAAPTASAAWRPSARRRRDST